MNTRKQPSRFLAILLSLCILFTMLPIGSITAFAAGDVEVIDIDTTWGTRTISNDVRIEKGATLTINGTITVSGEITISGGGTIARGSGNAYFSIGSGASLAIDGVTADGDGDGKNISSSNSMFNVSSGKLTLKNSTVQNCVRSGSYGGAIYVNGGTLTIEKTTIKDCSATSYGGAIYLCNGAEADIKSGTFSGNQTTSGQYGGGFIYNKASTLTIEGGSFENNSSAGKGGAIYNTAVVDTKTYIRGGVFEGNTSNYTSNYTDYAGSGAVFYSSVYTNETVLYISGSVRFGDGEASDGTDGVYLDSYSSTSTLRKMQISSALQHPVHIYVACAEDRVIAQGVEGYTLTAADMTKIQFHDTGSSDTNWYAWLNSESNEVYVSTTEPIYVVYDANGATGSVTDNISYSANDMVTVKSAEGFTYEGATFQGWNTKKDGSGTEYQPNNRFAITETTTLYAQWAYNVWVGGVQVTSSNASDVLGDADSKGATVSHNAETKTLTLNGANITATHSAPGGGYAAIISYDDLNIVLAEDSENKITLTGSDNLTGVIAISEGGRDEDAKNITVSGKGSLDIDINSSASAAIGITGSAVTINDGADVNVAANGEGVLNFAIMSAGAVTIENAGVTANGSAGISCMGDVSITGTSTVKATGSTSAIEARKGDITLGETLIAQGRADAAAGGLWAVTTNTIEGNNTFVLSSNTSIVARYVEIVPVSSLHYHAVCGETDCAHDGHEPVVYTALDDGGGNIADGITTSVLKAGNYYLTDDITNVNFSIEITGTVNLCLNGHTISGDAANGIFRVGAGGVLNVCDCGENGKITEDDGHNPIFLHSGGMLNLYSGTIESTITAVVIDEDPSDNTDSTGGTVNVYGGTVSSTGSGYQSIKVNANMTNAVVSIYGGELTSPNRGISAESGEIRVTGGTVNGNVVVANDVTMTGGTIKGQLTIDSSLGEKKSVKISGDAKIETTSGDAIYSEGNIDLEISGGTTITAQNGYAVSVTRSVSKIYLSGSPVIFGSSGDLRILPTTSADGAVLVLHAKDHRSSAYTGSSLSISSCGTYNKDYYVAQGVTDSTMAEKFSLVGLSDYYLAYDMVNQAIQIKEYTCTVTLPSGQDGYTVTAENGSTSPVKRGGSFSFSVTVDSANKYYKTSSFAVKANGTALTPDANGVYTISNITTNQTVTVEGVALDETAPTAEIQLGENKWNAFLNNITIGLFFKETQTVMISVADNESGVEKTEYFVSDTAYADCTVLEDAVSGSWETYSAAFSIKPNSKNVIYVKLTDNVGNVGYASSNGIVLYTDAAQDTQSISFTKTGTTDVTASVTLNGNTIDEIYCGEDLLTAGKHYTVNGGTITFKASWLDTLPADDYTLMIHYNPLGVGYVDDDENNAPATTSIALKVQKAAGSVTNLSDISKVYDGQPVSDVIYQASSTGDVTVEYKVRNADDSTYTTTKPSAVEEYTVRVTVATDDDYTEASATADFEITYLTMPDDPFDLSGAEGTDGWYTSNVTIIPPVGYTVSNALDGQYSNTLTISASEEKVTIYLKNEKGQMTGALSVGGIKIDKDNPTITATGNTEDYLTGDTAKITAADSASGVAKVEVKKDNGGFVDITASYEGGYSVTENGTYAFRVTDNAGRTAEKTLVYDCIDSAQPIAVIEATHGGESYTSGIWTNKDITLTPQNEAGNLGITTYQYREDGGQWQDYTAPVVISADTDADGSVYEFKAKSASGVESEPVSITVKRDAIAPEGDITIKENSIRQFFSTITFGLFFNEDVDVAITGTDDLSGVASIKYYRSADILTEEQVAALADEEWTEYAGPIRETAEDAEKFIYYVKVTDNADNTSCFASNGATFDLTPPSVMGVASGSTYFTTQKVTVTDANLDSVTLNSESIVLENGMLTLSGDMEATYTVTATDMAGNATTVTVTMKPIASLAENIQGLTEQNVASADKETVNAVKTDANAADTENATDEEKTALQDIINECDGLLNKIDETAGELGAVTDSIGGFDPDSVKSSDKEAIEEFVDRIDTLLGGGNLTEEEKAALETVKSNAEDLLDRIDQTVGAGDTENIQNVQDVTPDNVKPEDKENLEAAKEDIEQALKDYADNYTDEETAQFEEALKQLEEALGVIQRVEESEKVIIRLPDSVSPDDTEAEAQIDAAKEQYDALSDYEKFLVSDEAADKLNTLLSQLGDYRIIEGDGSTWTKGSSEGLTFIANGAYSKFIGIEIDGAVISTQNYTAASGSTMITLKSDYLNTLTAGQYTIVVIYTDGEAQGTFTISEKPMEPTEPTDTTEPADEDTDSPQTGDDSHIVPWIMLMLISGGAVLTLSIRPRSKKRHE